MKKKNQTRKSRSSKSKNQGYENLEPRQMLTTVSLDAGTLQVNGDSTANIVSVSSTEDGNLSVTTNDSGNFSFRSDDVSKIVFTAGGGNDEFTNLTDVALEAFGQGGNDRITGGAGDDVIHGGNGADVLFGGGGADEIRGSFGMDFLFGQGGNDQLFGGNDDDQIVGGGGNDFLNGEFGDDTLNGDGGDDQLLGFSGTDTLNGNAGNDLLFGQAGADTLNGGDGNDRVRGNPGNDTLHGDAGDDFVLGDQGDDFLFGDDGNDQLLGFDGDDFLSGGAGNDQLFGQNDNDTVIGGGGNDIVRGNAGDDILRGSGGNDSLIGDAGNDRLFGEAGADNLNGGAGRDGLVAGDSSADDTLTGGSGTDRFIVQNGDQILDSQQEDATLNFVDETSNWTDAELEVIDDGLTLLHNRLGNATLLQDSVPSGDLTFYKHDVLRNGQAAGLNELSVFVQGQERTYERAIRIADWDENNDFLNNFYTAVTIHEIGHNWDSVFELEDQFQSLTGLLNDFLDLSGWTPTDPGVPGFTQSGDGQWFYLTDSAFVEDFSTLNPFEDFSTVWEFYFENFENPGADLGDLQAKFDWADDFFNTLAS